MRSSYLYSSCKGLAIRDSPFHARRIRAGEMEPRQEVERQIRPKEPRHCQNSKPGPKTQRKEKPSSPALKVKGWNKSTHKLRVQRNN